MKAPNTQLFIIVAVKVNGIQKMAINRSATAKLIKKSRRSVLDLLPTANTTMTSKLPRVAARAVNAYTTTSRLRTSGDIWSAGAAVDGGEVPMADARETAGEGEMFPANRENWVLESGVELDQGTEVVASDVTTSKKSIAAVDLEGVG